MTYSKLGSDTKTGERVDIFKLSRLLGLYVIGLQGMGKSGLLEELIVQDIKQGIGVCVLDPHGDLVDNIIARLPEGKEEKVIYLDLAESHYFFGLNLFTCTDPTSDDEIIKVVSQVVHVFEKAFGISMENTPRIYDYLFNSAYTLISNPGYTLIDIPLVFDDACLQKLLANVSSTEVHKFWNDVKQLPQQKQTEEAREVLRRLNDLSHAPLRFIVGQSTSTIDLRKVMDEGKILLMRLDRRLEKATKLVGSIIVALILTASALGPTKKQFHLYADEFQNFATEDFAVLLEEARKSGIGITMAHQNRSQLELSDKQADKNLKTRTLNVGNLVVFRVPTDAESLAGQFDSTPPPPEIIGYDPVRVPKLNVLDDLLRGGGHPNPAVMAFVNTYLRAVETEYEDDDDEEEQFLSRFGAFVASVIATGDAEKPVPVTLFYNSSEEAVTKPLGFPYLFQILSLSRIEWNNETYMDIVSSFLTAPDGRVSMTPEERKFVIWRCINAEEERRRWDVDLGMTLGELSQLRVPGHLSNDQRERISREAKESASIYIGGRREELSQQLEASLANAEAFFVSLRAMLKGLLAEPILTDSGQYTPRYAPPRLISDVRAEIANELVRLPRFTARVKLSDGSGNAVEHTIQTVKPGKGLYGQALKEKKERICQQNITRHLNERAAVEAEITLRQRDCQDDLGGHADPRSTPQPPPATRKAKPPCSSCGFSNPIGSKFCNRCGKPL